VSRYGSNLNQPDPITGYGDNPHVSFLLPSYQFWGAPIEMIEIQNILAGYQAPSLVKKSWKLLHWKPRYYGYRF